MLYFHGLPTGFADYTSLLIMRKIGLEKVFTSDNDFKVMGFEILKRIGSLIKINQSDREVGGAGSGGELRSYFIVD